eukprot:TRINITY_DN12274_c0_g2_i1.p1 TRINITY_DN12274_c0_g2~~TRINITY_DN12274_c0_g2_i1.p1  ORF type:complete len:161 (+),score=21.41 TRINITY_DN12274_c0_g2_i1:61-543(+)
MFHLNDVRDLRKYVEEMGVSREEHLKWAEFLDLLFTYKRSVNVYHPVTPQKKYEAKEFIECTTTAEKHKTRAKEDNSGKSEDGSYLRKNVKATVPRPFKMLERQKSQCIKQKDILNQKAAEEEYLINYKFVAKPVPELSLIHICRCRRYAVCRSRWSPYH